jgi:hypothetical protein
MFGIRGIRKLVTLPLSVAALAGSASVLSAQQGRPLFEWSGRVDREVQIAMRDRETWLGGVDGQNARGRADVEGVLPRHDGRVYVRVENGRGNVDVVQQPSARNNYTTIVRIIDPQGGADRYRISAFWQGDQYGSTDDRYGRPGDYGRDLPGRGNGRDRANDRNDWPRTGIPGRGGERTAFHWTGNVDDALEIRIQGDRIDYRTLSGQGVRNVYTDMAGGGIPRGEDVTLQVQVRDGRGNVQVVQEPNARNGYVGVIRVYDPQPSFGRYDFDVTWR